MYLQTFHEVLEEEGLEMCLYPVTVLKEVEMDENFLTKKDQNRNILRSEGILQCLDTLWWSNSFPQYTRGYWILESASREIA